MNQDFNVDERAFAPTEYERLNQFPGIENRTCDLRLRRHVVDRRERKDRILIVIDR